MSTFLTFAIRLLDGRYHGRVDRGREPEWPPSPMRLFQAIVASVAPRWHDAAVRERERAALLWLERQPPPVIVTPAQYRHAEPLLTYVPNNNDPSRNERTAKTIAPTIIHGEDRPLIEWLYAIDPSDAKASAHARVLTSMVRHITHVGWGIDLAIGNGVVGPIIDAPGEVGRQRYVPLADGLSGSLPLRVPTRGTLASLEAVHAGKLARFAEAGTLTLDNRQPEFATVMYATSAARRCVAFRLVDENDEDVAYRTDHIKEIAGTLRHLVSTACTRHFEQAIIEGTVNGHPSDAPRLSILPLPSIGHRHVDGYIRRVVFAEAVGESGALVRNLRRALDERSLVFSGNCACLPSRLIALPSGDAVLRRYTTSATTWASVTPVLLPGHNQRKGDDPAKSIERACGLVAKSLQQAGIDAPAEFEINRLPYWPGARHVREYDPRDKLAHCPRFHVRIHFAQPVTGPLAIGAGRHVGFGTLAAIREEE